MHFIRRRLEQRHSLLITHHSSLVTPLCVQFYMRLLRWAFARFYREFAWTYDSVAWLVSRGLWRRWTFAALPYLEGRVLELGCGTGFVQQALAVQRPGACVGLDASPFMLALTRQRVRRVGLDAVLVQSVAQALPFASRRFQCVLATFPSEYILHPATLAEVQRVLLPGGCLVIIDGAQFVHSGLYERLVDLAYRLTFQVSVRQTPSYDQRLRWLERAGFQFALYQEPVGASYVTVMVGTVTGMASM